MKSNPIVWSLLAVSSVLTAAGAESPEAGKKMEQTACLPCHSLRLVESQRLSSAAWTKEIDKMVGWGAVVPERQKLIDYLAQEYSDAKPVPPPDQSAADKSASH